MTKNHASSSVKNLSPSGQIPGRINVWKRIFLKMYVIFFLTSEIAGLKFLVGDKLFVMVSRKSRSAIRRAENTRTKTHGHGYRPIFRYTERVHGREGGDWLLLSFKSIWKFRVSEGVASLSIQSSLHFLILEYIHRARVVSHHSSYEFISIQYFTKYSSIFTTFSS